MELGISGKRALVLGASRGLGAVIAETLAREGVQVIAAARKTGVMATWREALPSEIAARVRTTSIDLADLHSVEALAGDLLGDDGIDIIVNNGGGPPPGTAQAARPEDWISQFAAMAAHLFHLTGRLLPPMIERKWGRIITIGSSGIEQPIPNLAMSNGIRASVLGWSKTLATEVAANGITVNIVLPGRIETERVAELDAAAAKRLRQSVDQVEAASRATIPAGRYGRPQEFADVVCFLASERASYITGSKIRIDGGLIRGV